MKIQKKKLDLYRRKVAAYMISIMTILGYQQNTLQTVEVYKLERGNKKDESKMQG
jgi:hypothetical protein